MPKGQASFQCFFISVSSVKTGSILIFLTTQNTILLTYGAIFKDRLNPEVRIVWYILYHRPMHGNECSFVRHLIIIIMPVAVNMAKGR